MCASKNSKSRFWKKSKLVLLVVTTMLLASQVTLAEGPPEKQVWDKNRKDGPHLHFDQFESIMRQAKTRTYQARNPNKGESNLELGGSNETSVAVNPTDPLNIAYASLFEIRVSTDGGVSFEDPVQCKYPSSHFAAGDPVVAFDGQGRLFWVYLGLRIDWYSVDVFLVQCDPSTGEILPDYPVNIPDLAGVTGIHWIHDKPWMAIDTSESSPYQNNIYLVWTAFRYGEIAIGYSQSTDQGQSWSEFTEIPGSATGHFTWPAHVALASNGDVYCAYHAMSWNNQEGSSHIRMVRSEDGGLSFSQIQPHPSPAPQAYVGTNDQMAGGAPGTEFWWQGSFQPWILPDPHDPAHLSIVFCADPEIPIGVGDDANVYIINSNDFGQTWTPRQRVDTGPEGTFQIYPCAAVDPEHGTITVTWMDNRGGMLNENMNYLLDTYAAVSFDGGNNFQPEIRINDVSFDPDQGSTCRFDCGVEYRALWVAENGVAFAGGDSLAFWDGQTWSRDNSTDFNNANGIWGIDENQVWAVGMWGRVDFFNGTTWDGIPSGVTNFLYGISGSSASDIYAVGTTGTILHYDGHTLSAQVSGTSENLWGIHVLPDGTSFAVGDAGTVLEKSEDTWQALPSIGSDDMLFSCWASAVDDLWVSSINGDIYRWNGEVWTSLPRGPILVYAIFGTAHDDIFFSGYGEVWHWDGSSLTNNHFCEYDLYGLGCNTSGEIFAAGWGGVIAKYDGQNWTMQDNPGSPETPTFRIGEYNGVAASGAVALATFVGNRHGEEGQILGQQAIFDAQLLGLVSVPVEQATSIAFLEPGQPNPFRWITSVSYSLGKDQNVSCGIYDVRGHLVRELQLGAQESGEHTLTWDGRDKSGTTAAGGIYFLKLETGGKMHTQKLTLVR